MRTSRLGALVLLLLSIAGVTDPAQPYNGQWARIDVVDAVAF